MAAASGPTTLATAADERYGYHLLNMIGSVKTNSDVFDAIVAFDLGLDPRQRRLLDLVDGVEVRSVPPFAPHWAAGRTWKPWIWTHLEAKSILWLDAGLTVLRPVDEAIAQIEERGYFAVSQGHPVRDSVPSDWCELLGFRRELGDRDSIAAGIFGFSTSGWFYERVVIPTYKDCLRGLSTGFSPGDIAGRNAGLDYSAAPPVRDCAAFRWDQSVLNVRFYLSVPDPVVHDLEKFAGWRSPRDHPRQVIWSHRRQGSLRYIKRLPFAGTGGVPARAAAVGIQAQWWLKLHRHWFRRSTYVSKARLLLGRPA